MTKIGIKYNLALLALGLAATAACGGVPDEADDAQVQSVELAIKNGSPLVPGTPQMLVYGGPNDGAACSAVIYNAHWVITAAHCIGAYDDNNDGVITKAEMEAHNEPYAGIGNGPDRDGNLFPSNSNLVDLVVKNKEGAFSSGTGLDVVLMHVEKPFDVAWIQRTLAQWPLGLGRMYSSGVLNIWTSTAKVATTTKLLSMGLGADGNGGYGAPLMGVTQMIQDYGSWSVIGDYQGSGNPLSGDSGGPNFISDGSRLYLFGITSGGDNDVTSQPNVSYFAQWLKDWTGT